jgi:hypothetical protein
MAKVKIVNADGDPNATVWCEFAIVPRVGELIVINGWRRTVVEVVHTVYVRPNSDAEDRGVHIVTEDEKGAPL